MSTLALHHIRLNYQHNVIITGLCNNHRISRLIESNDDFKPQLSWPKSVEVSFNCGKKLIYAYK